MRPSLSNNYGTGGRKEKSFAFAVDYRVRYIAADVSKLNLYCFLLHLHIANFPLHFHPLPEVSATPVVFFYLRIKRGCRTYDLLSCLTKISRMDVLAQLSIVFLFLVIIWRYVGKCLFSKKMC